MCDSSLSTYRRTLTSANDEPVAWWYLGTGIVTIAGHPPLIINHVETVMIYDAKTLSDGAYRIPWWEIGIFRDPITGEIPETWVNPLTGQCVEPARKFEEGPSGFSVREGAAGGVEIFDAVQAFAQLESAEVTFTDFGSRICITQTERKRRAFPEKDGIPDLTDSTGSQAHTVLQWFASKADLATGLASVPATGMYSLDIATPPWLGFERYDARFAIAGIMHKAPMNAPLNPRGWAQLQEQFPHYFRGDKIMPRWT